MNRLPRYFLNGLILSAPIGLTLYVCWRIFRAVDSWLGLPWYGAGFIATLFLITLVGWLATTFFWNTLFGLVEHAMERVPVVRFLYNSLKEVLGAFVGDKKRFDRPVVVTLMPGGQRPCPRIPDPGIARLDRAERPGGGLPPAVLQLRGPNGLVSCRSGAAPGRGEQ